MRENLPGPNQLLIDAASAGAQAAADCPLFCAAQRGDEAKIRTLLATDGAERRARANCSHAPLIAAALGRHAGVVKLLLDAGADPETADPASGCSALVVVAQSGGPSNCEVALLLLRAGADARGTLDMCINDDMGRLLSAWISHLDGGGRPENFAFSIRPRIRIVVGSRRNAVPQKRMRLDLKKHVRIITLPPGMRMIPIADDTDSDEIK